VALPGHCPTIIHDKRINTPHDPDLTTRYVSMECGVSTFSDYQRGI